MNYLLQADQIKGDLNDLITELYKEIDYIKAKDQDRIKELEGERSVFVEAIKELQGIAEVPLPKKVIKLLNKEQGA